MADMYRVWGDRLDVVDQRTGKAWTVRCSSDNRMLALGLIVTQRLDWTNYWVHVLENTTDPEALAMLAQALIKITWDWRELVGARQVSRTVRLLSVDCR